MRNIIVLDDGTWSTSGVMLRITEEAFVRLYDGDRPGDLGPDDVLEYRPIAGSAIVEGGG